MTERATGSASATPFGFAPHDPSRARSPYSCVISGYDRIGRELYAEELIVDDDPFTWELSGNCAFASDFEYASE